MNNPFDLFDKIYCIHLPQHEDRKKKIEKEFKKYGMSNRVQYIHATPPPKGFSMSNMRRAPRGEFGVNLSQIKAIVHAISDKAEYPLFLEDDVEFRKNSMELLGNALSELPEDWQILYMGGHPRRNPDAKPRKAQRYSKTLAKISRMSFADAYCIRQEVLLKFFDVWVNNITKKNAMYDFILGNFVADYNTYCVYPIICEQPPMTSSISGKFDDKRNLVARGWENHLGKT